jgi:hypothetical protein
MSSFGTERLYERFEACPLYAATALRVAAPRSSFSTHEPAEGSLKPCSRQHRAAASPALRCCGLRADSDVIAAQLTLTTRAIHIFLNPYTWWRFMLVV